jgi:hypothetical protein
VSIRVASMRLASILGAAIGLVVACTAAQIDQIDPVVYVDGATCPDENGNPQKVIAGYFCCAGPPSYLGPGQCPDGTSCMAPDSCTATPLPPNYGAARPTKRRGLK